MITGASRGIGRAIAGCLADEGWDLLISARGGQGLEEAVTSPVGVGYRRTRRAGRHGQAVRRRATRPGAVRTQPELDLLVLAAGTGSGGPIDGYRMDRLDLQFAVNVRAPFQLVSLLLPPLRAAARHRPELGARIVAMSSISGHAAEPGLAAYVATKAALTLFCKTVTSEEGGNGVLATAVAPGYVDTDMAAWVHASIPPEQMMKTSDIAELTLALTRLSRWAAVPSIVMTRPGPNLHRA